MSKLTIKTQDVAYAIRALLEEGHDVSYPNLGVSETIAIETLARMGRQVVVRPDGADIRLTLLEKDEEVRDDEDSDDDEEGVA